MRACVSGLTHLNCTSAAAYTAGRESLPVLLTGTMVRPSRAQNSAACLNMRACGHFRRDGHELRRRQRGPQSGGFPLPLVTRDIVWRAVFSFRARDIERGPWCLLLCAAVIRA